MKIHIIYAGNRGSAREASLAFYEIFNSAGFSCDLIFSDTIYGKMKIEQVYPEARFINFLSPLSFTHLNNITDEDICFFPMTSPKLFLLYLFSKTKKIFYFHSTYDYSFSPPTLKDIFIEKTTEFYVHKSNFVFTTQYPLAWQIKYRLGIDAQVIPHPTYYFIKKDIFTDMQKIALPFKNYFLFFGDLERPAKGMAVLIDAVRNTDIPIVIAGKGNRNLNFPKNIFQINRWITDQELYWLVNNSKAIVLPYLTSSQFSGCLALAYRFGKPVVVPLSNSFHKYVVEYKTGLFFEQGNPSDLKEKLADFDRFNFSKSVIRQYDKNINENIAKKITLNIKEIIRKF